MSVANFLCSSTVDTAIQITFLLFTYSMFQKFGIKNLRAENLSISGNLNRGPGPFGIVNRLITIYPSHVQGEALGSKGKQTLERY